MKELEGRIEARLGDMFRNPGPPDSDAAYESRVLRGIWATAPYLHNGSVPNLWELLKPAGQRVKSFYLANDVYDLQNVGFVSTDAEEEGRALPVFDTNVKSNGNGGHEGDPYGTTLSDADKWALIEYLKRF